MKDSIESLEARIQALETENRLLKERLDEAGISYADIVAEDYDDKPSALYDPDQGARIKRFEVTDKVANDFFMMFCRGRKDVYELRYTNPRTGKNGYYTQCYNRWDRSCHIQKKDGVRCKNCEIRAYKPITLPLIKDSFLSGLVTAFVRSITAISAVILLVTPDFLMITCQINEQAEKGNYGVACAYATVLIMITYTAVAVMNLIIKHFGTSRAVKEED